ncbi:MAG: Dyp-type peroxidase, partial [Candidatus Binatia bacterium]
GIVRSGYAQLRHARFVLLRIDHAEQARVWLRGLLDAGGITDARSPERRQAANLALTAAGLERLGVRPDTLGGFSAEFVEGIVTPHRSRLLGDEGASAPQAWEWGGPGNDPVHAILLLYAAEEPLLETHLAAHIERLRQSGLHDVWRLPTEPLPRNGEPREHFGFRDGIGQPRIRGFGDDQPAGNTLAPGEILFGHPDEAGERPAGPTHPGAAELGREGSYLVVRQLRQDVAAFWRFVAERATDPHDRLRIAARMVGRWPSGAPLVKAPVRKHPPLHEEEKKLERDNDFGYQSLDPYGFSCPLGSHIRRANPRDSVVPDEPELSLRISNRHRILRRGRIYGPPVDESMDPARMIPRILADGGSRLSAVRWAEQHAVDDLLG